jgi:hypothetical protein
MSGAPIASERIGLGRGQTVSAMSDPFGKLFFPLTTLKFSNVFQAGQTSLDLRVARKAGSYSSTILKEAKALKLSLEKIDQHDFTQALLQGYFFRQPDKEYGALPQLLARFGLHKKSPLVMEYADQTYKLNLKVRHGGETVELKMSYSPSVGRVVVRAGEGGRE